MTRCTGGSVGNDCFFVGVSEADEEGVSPSMSPPRVLDEDAAKKISSNLSTLVQSKLQPPEAQQATDEELGKAGYCPFPPPDRTLGKSP